MFLVSRNLDDLNTEAMVPMGELKQQTGIMISYFKYAVTKITRQQMFLSLFDGQIFSFSSVLQYATLLKLHVQP